MTDRLDQDPEILQLLDAGQPGAVHVASMVTEAMVDPDPVKLGSELPAAGANYPGLRDAPPPVTETRMPDSSARLRLSALAGPGALLLCLVTPPLNAQEQGVFVVTKGLDTLAVEVSRRDSIELRGTLTRRQGEVGERVRYRATILEDESAPLVDLSVWRIDDPEESPARQSVRVIFKDDSVAVDEANRWGGLTTRVMGTERAAIPYFAGSIALLELVTRRAAGEPSGDAVVPVFNLGGGQTVHGRVHRVAADSVTLTIGTVEYRLQVDQAGRILGGIVPGQDLRLSRAAEQAGS
jgi:hypothetical protein